VDPIEDVLLHSFPSLSLPPSFSLPSSQATSLCVSSAEPPTKIGFHLWCIGNCGSSIVLVLQFPNVVERFER
jgi:hypothetical protein